MDYRSAGVDIKKAENWVDFIKSRNVVKDKRVVGKIGHYAAVYEITGNKCVTATTDGVGTKLKLAIDTNIHNTIGIDLVAMNVNDLIVIGSKPLFVLDYMALGKISDETKKGILEGIIAGCEIAGVSLIGGETAQMPDMYKDGEYDLAAFCVGEIEKQNIINGQNIVAGDVIIGLKSTGFHSNGYSLIRKLVKSSEIELMKRLLTPTKIYVKEILSVLNDYRADITGMAHITGSGLRNLFRLNENVGFEFDNFPKSDEIFFEIQKRAKISNTEMFETFNMGIGYMLIVKKDSKLLTNLSKYFEDAQIIGKVSAKKEKITVSNLKTEIFR